MPSPAQREAYAIEVRIQALLEARGIEEQYWPWYDDELRTQAEQERRHMAFDPSKHLIKLPRRGRNKDTGEWETVYDDYLEVKHRLVWFRDRFPHGEIITEEVHVDLDRLVTVETQIYVKGKRETATKTGTGYARFKTTARDGEGGVSTGYGTESAAEFADFVERAETRSIGRALAGLGIGTQFVGEELGERLELREPARTGLIDDIKSTLDELAKPETTAAAMKPAPPQPIVQEPHQVLGRKPIEKLNQQECVFRLQDELKRLTGTEQDDHAKSLRVSLLTSVFGTGIHSFTLAAGQGKSALQRGLLKLEAMEVPDVPPSDGNPQEGPSLPPGATHENPSHHGPTQDVKVASNGKQVDTCATVQHGTGFRCVREPLHKGDHYFPPPRPEERPAVTEPALMTPPDAPTIVDGYASVADVHVLAVWCMMHEHMDTFREMTEMCPIEEGPCISQRLWDRIVAAVTYQVEHVS